MVTTDMKLKESVVLERIAMTKLDSILKSRDITLKLSLCQLKAMAFPISQLFTSGGQSIVASALASEYSGSISFRIDWFDLLAVQETLKSLLQCHSSKASILWCSAFFMVQLSHPYLTTGKAIALSWQSDSFKVMSLLLNMLSRLVVTFLPRSKHLLISWLKSPSAVIFEPKKIV